MALSMHFFRRAYHRCSPLQYMVAGGAGPQQYAVVERSRARVPQQFVSVRSGVSTAVYGCGAR
eukprot:9019571-Lingulodinium_polyedra.AAC.1